MAFGLFFAVPLLWLVLATTKSGQQLQTGAPLAWGSLHQLIHNWDALRSFEGDAYAGWFGNTVEYAFAALVLVLLVDIPAGYALALTSLRIRRPMLLLTLVVMLVPNTVLVLPVFLEVNRAGLVGSAWSVILPFSFFPFGVYLTYLYFSTSVPRDLLAAARIDGCSELQVFLRIALPLAKPVVALVALFSFVANWNNYFLPFVMLPSSRSYPLQVGLVNLPRGGPSLALATLISSLPVLVVFLGAQRYVVTGLTAGSTTG
ncbi:carbohydrate ABC transporter permease [Acidothermaceae bacterium B102]|nr:carbohydrate ABC transporter permease [Acidothermaceae bacterium B102]